MLGTGQQRWLLDGLANSRARWNFIGNQVLMGDNLMRRPDQAEGTYPLDTWNGYIAERQLILDAFAANKVSNPVVLTGDIHVSIALELRTDWANPSAPPCAVELVGTAISSGGDGRQMTDAGRIVMDSNPHMKFFDGRRGYVRVAVNRERLTADYRIVPYISRLGAPAETPATFVVENGTPRLQRT
jgi:alkaline phosphatase D